MVINISNIILILTLFCWNSNIFLLSACQVLGAEPKALLGVLHTPVVEGWGGSVSPPAQNPQLLTKKPPAPCIPRASTSDPHLYISLAFIYQTASWEL